MNNAGHPSSYVILSENSGGVRPPPPYRRHIPKYQSHKRGRGWCCRCLCCCYCFLFLLIFISAGFCLYVFSIYRPKIPSYNVQSLDVRAFKLQPDYSLYTEFLVTVEADNPNEKIGFVYGEGSSVVVSYKDSTLSSGKLPDFHQDAKNTSVMKISLAGRSEFGSGLQEALMQNRNNGRIPLLVRVKAPVSVVFHSALFGNIRMREIKALVNCSLVVDNLAPNKHIGIVSKHYDVTVSVI